MNTNNDTSVRDETTKSSTIRPLISIAAGTGVVAFGVAAALLTRDPLNGVTTWVERASSTVSTWLTTVGDALPFGYAFAAGLVSAVNPCGFAMLPAYLGLYLGTSDTGAGGEPGRRAVASIGRAFAVAALVTAGFVLLFGLIGGAFSAGARELARAFPWIGLLVGTALIVAGAWLMSGRALYSAAGERAAARVRGLRGAGARSYFAFGVAYGTASLSCTLPIFLTVVGNGLASTSVPGVAIQFLLYAFGMGTVVLLLSLSMALFRGALIGRLRAALRFIQPVTIVLLFVAGAYLVFYWLTTGGLLGS